ncbi:hypothetical protein ACEQ6A_16985 [Rhizobium brockwellii]|uniref:hypothetical protein n=1 Tax=Rhizobium brockwellii TaxID=3019932 RepID=UPI003F963787
MRGLEVLERRCVTTVTAMTASPDYGQKNNSFAGNVDTYPPQYPINAQGAIFWQAAQSEVMRQGKRRFLAQSRDPCPHSSGRSGEGQQFDALPSISVTRLKSAISLPARRAL